MRYFLAVILALTIWGVLGPFYELVFAGLAMRFAWLIGADLVHFRRG